jgi:energy-coupling factor transporter ATP-binding protein EcfA2
MARLTKTEIEQALLAGKKIEWKDAVGKKSSIVLDSAKQRRLFAYLLSSKVREVKGLPDDCVTGLAAAHIAPGDPATQQPAAATTTAQAGPWKLACIKTEGFGGVNAWKGAPFELQLEGNSILLEGPNGSGKSSLTAAIVWALSGERPRDQAEAASDELRPVFGIASNKAGDWPPVATYPNELMEILLGPNVSVELTFTNPAGTKATVRRAYDGKKMTHVVDPQLTIPSTLLEAGLLMPSRLPKLRFDEGRGKLTDAVQTLTGLDDLIELGAFIQGLCHSGRDYLSYKKNELASAKSEFDEQIEAARVALAAVNVVVPDFKIADTDDANGAMAKFGKEQIDKAGNLTKVVSDDLAPSLDLADAQTQKQVAIALSGAETAVSSGLVGLQRWKTFDSIANALSVEVRQRLAQSVADARAALALAVDFHNKAQSDTRYRLKASAARWHAEHRGGAIDDCPTCQHSIKDKPDLQAELAELQSAGEAATRKLSDNVTGIMADLEAALPQTMRRYLSEDVTLKPRAELAKAFEDEFVSAERYQKYLARAGALAKAALATAPATEMTAAVADKESVSGTAILLGRIDKIEKLSSLAEWFEAASPTWQKWWTTLSAADPLPDGTIPATDPETLSAHIGRIGKSLAEAEPFRQGAEAMRSAWKQGVAARKIEKELVQRQAIADALAPLKSLGNMAEAQARDALNDLSSKIAQIHSANYLSDTLKFDSATLEKKAGLVVRGQLGAEIRIDATLVANTSWIRGILWAFIFALREESVEQMGSDVFPLMVLDDPQQTFDTIHRHRWAEYVAKLQAKTPGVQVILSSHDEQFLSFLAVDGVVGRKALISSAGAELGHVGVFEGDELDRRWKRMQAEKTQKAAQDYMAAVRVYVEGMLKLMLRGEDVDVATFVLGSSREKLTVLNKAKHEPWARDAFEALANVLGKNVKEIKFIEKAHHSDGAAMGMAEAADVQAYWTKPLRPALEKAFRIVREHRALHGGLTALHAMPPTVSLPEGHRAAVGAIKLPLVGSAAALSDGKAADGCVNLTIDGKAKEIIELKSNAIYRLTTPTLEPVARPGDLLLVSEFKKPTAKSLVVARSEDRLMARRLEIADNHSDVAVLTANAINPRMIAAPVVAKLSTLTMQKIIGVIYGHEKAGLGQGGDEEICDCGGDSHVKAAFANMQGLISVDGYSAEPHALDKQFLIIANPMPVPEACKKLEGQPIIAEDSSGSRYFKRLRSGEEDLIILESLEIGGNFPPITLTSKPGSALHVQTIWPVLGVLFERPS